jgi:hypothetical protein
MNVLPFRSPLTKAIASGHGNADVELEGCSSGPSIDVGTDRSEHALRTRNVAISGMRSLRTLRGACGGRWLWGVAPWEVSLEGGACSSMKRTRGRALRRGGGRRHGPGLGDSTRSRRSRCRTTVVRCAHSPSAVHRARRRKRRAQRRNATPVADGRLRLRITSSAAVRSAGANTAAVRDASSGDMHPPSVVGRRRIAQAA